MPARPIHAVYFGQKIKATKIIGSGLAYLATYFLEKVQSSEIFLKALLPAVSSLHSVITRREVGKIKF